TVSARLLKIRLIQLTYSPPLLCNRKPPSLGGSWLVHGEVVFASEICDVGIQKRRVAVNPRLAGFLVRCNVVVCVHAGRRVRHAPPEQAIMAAEDNQLVLEQRSGLLHWS